MSLIDTETPATEPAATPPATDPAATGTPPATDPAATGTPPADAGKALPAPEGYTAFAMPEGFELAPETLTKFTDLAKELKLPQDKAQAFLDMATANQKAQIEAQAENWNKVCDTWVEEITADKEFGGAKLKETCAQANNAIKRFGNQALFDFLDSTGYGNNPDILRFLAKVDRATSEDKIIDGKPPASNTKSAAEVMYGTP